MNIQKLKPFLPALTLVVLVVLIFGAVVTWRLLPGRKEAVNELVSH